MPPAGASASSPGSYVHAISIQVVTFHDQVAQVQAHPEHESSVGRLVLVGFSHGLLNSTRAPSPVSLTSRPPYSANTGSRCSERFLRRRASVPVSSRPFGRE